MNMQVKRSARMPLMSLIKIKHPMRKCDTVLISMN